MKEYPPDMLPLYAQGYSLARYLIDQGGRQKFLNYVGEGLKRENWTGATKSYYGYRNLAHLQDSWLEWVKQGSPQVDKRQDRRTCLPRPTKRPAARKTKTDSIPIAQARFQSDDRTTALTRRRDEDRSTFESKGDLVARDDRGK